MAAPPASALKRSPVVHGAIACYAPERADGGFDSAAIAAIAAAEEGHFWLRHRSRLIAWAVERHAGGARRGLDLGCGAGSVMVALGRSLPGLVLDGADLSLAALELVARRLPGARLMQMDAADPPCAATYDLVGMFDVLEHIDDDRAVLAGAERMLVPGGRLILTVPRHPFLWSHLDALVHHRRRYRAADLLAKVRAAGLEVHAVIGYGALLLPVAFLARFAYRNSRGIEQVMRIHPVINTVLDGVDRFERMLIRAGVRFPFGDSLMIVAAKPGTP